MPPPTVSSFKHSRVPPYHPASLPHHRRIANLPPDEKEARYLALLQRYGVPAFCPGQSLSKAVCFKCHEKGHLASKCPTKQETVTQQPATPSTSLHAAAPALHTSPLEDVHGSHLESSFFTADIAHLGSYDAFLDTGSKITIVTKSSEGEEHFIRQVTRQRLLPELQPCTRPGQRNRESSAIYGISDNPNEQDVRPNPASDTSAVATGAPATFSARSTEPQGVGTYGILNASDAHDKESTGTSNRRSVRTRTSILRRN
ncbi:hypothetical protein HPB49_003933 [Dermacentor silvarum]|uniref:Uncharacterized protein n=1 Tax=Dermacentor silvarum TaxID=543639 RepID=A0ACB8DUE9_DERSI|nr:hypothetical protein HPB49_003933 [Dermacentor silvarum]